MSLWGNQVASFPEEVEQLTSLEVLYLNGKDQLASLPLQLQAQLEGAY